MVHSDNLRFTAGERLQDISKVFVRHVGIKRLERFQLVTQVILAKDDFGPRHKEFKSFTTHLFDENRNLHLATSAEGKYTGRLRLDELQRNKRSLICRAVSSLPSRPANGESFTRKFIWIVGGSMSTNSRAILSSRSVN